MLPNDASSGLIAVKFLVNMPPPTQSDKRKALRKDLTSACHVDDGELMLYESYHARDFLFRLATVVCCPRHLSV